MMAIAAGAQTHTTVTATIDKNKILIGEPIKLTLQAEIPENEPIRFFMIDTLPHFEFLEKEKIDTSNTSDGTRLRQMIRITSFDSGHWVLPALDLGDNISTDTLPVDVVFSDFNPDSPYHDIHEIIDVVPPKKGTPWWIYLIGAGVALLIALLFILLRKKKKKPEPMTAWPIEYPYNQAMRQLEALQKSQLDPKEYYSQLVDIFRLYIYRRKGILSLQKTTDDLVVQLAGLQVEKGAFEKLSQALRLSDFVKFARYIPSREDDGDAFESIKKAIEEIERTK
jgi:LPXTG-motif cell wall-anchored protein